MRKRGRRQLDRALDQRIGALLKQRRIQLGWSQQGLGSRLGLTFQQVQKYEKGDNQLSVARLLQVCGTLEVGIGYFLDANATPLEAARIDHETTRVITRIKNDRVKSAILRLARECA
ncbi:MAG: helix-turn-helix transcriptional regulator [Alphaproteobacteria bacterium]|nr:helix-turn-helix transcriptional regulator [Alphaproteobacteria bacterium]